MKRLICLKLPQICRWIAVRLLTVVLFLIPPAFGQDTDLNLTITPGWNLLGNPFQKKPIQVAEHFFGVNSVWTWNGARRTWALYVPALAAKGELASYAATQGYDVLTTIQGGEGFWVNASDTLSFRIPAGQPVIADQFGEGRPGALHPGWNLIAIGRKQSPGEFNAALSITPPSAGTTPENLTSLWAWHGDQWLFHAPSLEARGGTVLRDYARSRGLGDFASAGQNLTQGMGFWVNRSGPFTSVLPFPSAQAMESYLKQALAKQSKYENDKSYALDTRSAAATSPALAAGNTASAFTTTNLQEAGVDEADRLMTDGEHLFIFDSNYGDSSSTLLIRRLTGNAPVETTAGAGSEPLAKLSLPSDGYFNQGYLAWQRPDNLLATLLAVGEGQSSVVYGASRVALPVARDWFAPWKWVKGKILLQWINVSDRSSPTLGSKLVLDGYQVATRRIGETVYVVSRYSPHTLDPSTAKLVDLLPRWAIDDQDQGPLVDASRCYLPTKSDRQATADLIVVSAIDLAKPGATPRSLCLVGASEAVFVSTESLYVATSRFDYGVAKVDGRDVANYPVEAATDIHKFSLTADGPVYRGSGSVIGHLGWEQDKKSFRMGENRGVLRIVTSRGQDWDGSASTLLTLLKEHRSELRPIATLPNANRTEPIGKPGERLYAARFLGDRGYFVTFRITDPLYVVDLSDDRDPRLAGELSIPGYSDYLHPIGEQYLLGVGKDAIAASTGDGRGAWYQGVKVALFDVSDPTRLKEINSLIIGKRGSQSTALYDHHAFTFLPISNGNDLGRLALPIARHTTHTYGDMSQPTTWYDWTDTGLHLFDVRKTGMSQHGEMIVERREASSVNFRTTDSSSDRAFLTDQEAHYIHGNQIWARRW